MKKLSKIDDTKFKVGDFVRLIAWSPLVHNQYRRKYLSIGDIGEIISVNPSIPAYFVSFGVKDPVVGDLWVIYDEEIEFMPYNPITQDMVEERFGQAEDDEWFDQFIQDTEKEKDDEFDDEWFEEFIQDVEREKEEPELVYPPVGTTQDLVTVLGSAGRMRKIVEIEYTKTTGPETGVTKAYAVEPYSLRHRIGKEYFYGFDVVDDSIKCFITNSLRRVEILPYKFTPQWIVEIAKEQR